MNRKDKEAIGESAQIIVGWMFAGAGAHLISSGKYVIGAIFVWVAFHALVLLHAKYRGRP